MRDYKDPFSLFEFQDNAYLTSLPDMAVYQELRTESKYAWFFYFRIPYFKIACVSENLITNSR